LHPQGNIERHALTQSTDQSVRVKPDYRLIENCNSCVGLVSTGTVVFILVNVFMTAELVISYGETFDAFLNFSSFSEQHPTSPRRPTTAFNTPPASTGYHAHSN